MVCYLWATGHYLSPEEKGGEFWGNRWLRGRAEGGGRRAEGGGRRAEGRGWREELVVTNKGEGGLRKLTASEGRRGHKDTIEL